MARGKPVVFDVIPHPGGEWLLKPTRGAPFGLWYRERAHAVSYAERVAREVESAEILIRNSDGSVERRIMGRAS
jgi:Uncharacterized protein conserved in bacteria (DUF2188)